MLFSHPGISDYIRTHFAAAWQSVRPVPRATIDFGNGHTLVRTMNGNVATYLCDPQGRVLDIIPGILDPELYLAQLRAAFELYDTGRTDLERAVTAHHRTRGATPLELAPELRRLSPALLRRLGVAPASAEGLPFVSKIAIELPTRSAFGLLNVDEERLLWTDTQRWYRELAPRVHRLLSDRLHTPAELTKTVYRELLHADLDDPFLGLSIDVFDNGAYPHDAGETPRPR